MLVITAERVPHDPGTVFSGAPDDCVSWIVFAGEPLTDGHWKPGDPAHCVLIVPNPELMAHV